MLSFGDYVLLGALGAALVIAVISMIRNRNKCGGSCSGCKYSDACEKRKDNEE